MRIVEVRHNCASSEQVTLEYGQVAVFYCARSGSCNTAYENTGAGALYECVDDDSVRRGAIAVHQATTEVEVVTMGVAPVTPGCVHDHALVVLDVDQVDISHLDVIVAAVASTTGSAAAALNYGGRNLPGNNLATPWGPWASTSGLGGIEVAWFGRSDNQGTLGLGRTVTRGAEYVSNDSGRDSGWAVSMTTISPGYGPAPNDVHLDGMSVFSNAPGGHRRLAGSLVFWGPFVPLPLGAPKLDAPVTLRMGESLTGVFADPTVDATYFSLVDLPVGSRYEVGDQISGRPWYAGVVRDKSIQGGLVSYSLETLLATLGRVRPREALILVAGENGAPDPLTLRECLVRFLDYYAVPYDPDIPEFYLRAGEELVIPTVPAFVIQPNQQSPASLYELLEPFYGVFRNYTFRADERNRLVVTPPAWLDTLGVRLNLWRRQPTLDTIFSARRTSASVPWSAVRRPQIEWTASVDGQAFAGALPAPLELGAPAQDVTLGPVTVKVEWRDTDGHVAVAVTPEPPPLINLGSYFDISVVVRPEADPDGTQALELTVNDLGPDEVRTSSADTVVNQVVIPVRARAFQTGHKIMQAAALALRSPGGVMAGAFGNNYPFGPLAEELETPEGFLELVNDTVQEGAWFWPIDEAVVIQPGGSITVAYDVEEWAEQWRDPSGPHAPASQVNTFADTVELPASGASVKLFDFQFPRQTQDFPAPSPYGARGSVYGRWRAGESPGVELTVRDARFAEFGYLPELGPFGQTVYFLWGVVVKLNGTGAVFTAGELHTYRFGFTRGADGLWEGGANLPGLSESQALYPGREYTAPELPYEVDHATALAMARGIVEENLTPKVVHSLTIPAARAGGYAVGPWHVGRAVSVPALGVSGRVTSIDYSEAHTPQAQGDTSLVTIDVEANAAPAGSRAASRHYQRAAYGASHYQPEEE